MFTIEWICNKTLKDIEEDNSNDLNDDLNIICEIYETILNARDRYLDRTYNPVYTCCRKSVSDVCKLLEKYNKEYCIHFKQNIHSLHTKQRYIGKDL